MSASPTSDASTPLANGAVIERAPTARIDALMLEHSVQQGNAAAIFYLAVTALLMVYLGRTVPLVALILWGAIVAVCCVARHLHTEHARRLVAGPAPQQALAHCAAQLSVIATATGLSLSAGFVAFFSDLDATEHTVFIIALSGITCGAVSTLSPIPRALTGYVLALTVPVFLIELWASSARSDMGFAIIALLCLALLFVVRAAGRSFYRQLLDAVTLRVENVQLIEDLESAIAQLTNERDSYQEQAAVDALTQLPNRRQFDEHLDREWRQCRRSGTPLSVALLDIDYFKPYNDNRGHAAGDRCLRRVGKALQGALRRPYDFVARYGGEEFVVVLPTYDGADALRALEHVRAALAAAEIGHGSSPIGRDVTMSMGLATRVPATEDEVDVLLQAADLSLYRAKEAGRNRIEVAGEAEFGQAKVKVLSSTTLSTATEL